MNIVGKLIVVLIVIVPIIICIVSLNKLSDEDEFNSEIISSNGNSTSLAPNVVSGEQIIIIDDEGQDIVSAVMAGEEYVSTIGEPISKLYTDASVSVSVANVYDESNENSKIVGTIEKNNVIIAQKYPSGWSRVTNNTISGWMRTDNISFPEGSVNLSVTNSLIGKSIKITAEPCLNMRSTPKISNNSNIITTIPYNTELKILDVSDDWYKVTYASSTGWISSKWTELK